MGVIISKIEIVNSQTEEVFTITQGTSIVIPSGTPISIAVYIYNPDTTPEIFSYCKLETAISVTPVPSDTGYPPNIQRCQLSPGGSPSNVNVLLWTTMMVSQAVPILVSVGTSTTSNGIDFVDTSTGSVNFSVLPQVDIITEPQAWLILPIILGVAAIGYILWKNK